MNFLKLFNTIKYLHYKQVYYRLFYLVRNKQGKKIHKEPLVNEVQPLHWKQALLFEDSFLGNNTFSFLNITHRFEKKIDWNFTGHGKLWTYNLNYFDFLNQKSSKKEKALGLIWNFVANENDLKDGLEPYPISLRGINWIKFFSNNSISEKRIDQSLYNQYQILMHNLEFHLLGNHLLENAYSLLFGAYYFRDDKIYQKAKAILKAELEEQVLDDGAHFELSPMYHQILLHRLLDCINLLENNQWKENELHSFLESKAKKMLGWLKSITYSNGSIPMVNDCACGIAPNSKQLFDYAKYLKISFEETKLSESGYRKFRRDGYELFLDVGNVGPDYQPGHAHSDTFSFELYLSEKPFIVDVGTSTYEKDEKRQKERQTLSHNTVMVNGKDQSQVWGGFRVAKRAKIAYLKESSDVITSAHDGYRSEGIMHERSFYASNNIVIQDKIISKKDKNRVKSQAFFHFHPSVNGVEINKRQVSFQGTNVSLSFDGDVSEIKLQEYSCSMGFNKTEIAKKICVKFSKELTTTILL